MPVNDGLNNLLAQISALEEQQAVFLEASTETYSWWWVKLNTMKAGKSRRAADDSLIAVNQQNGRNHHVY